jgi:hypothetical protein
MQPVRPEKLNPTNGHLLAGTRLAPHLFSGRVKASQLFSLAPDPRKTEDDTERNDHPELQELWLVRREVQRLFEGAKEKNVPSYAQYIVDMHHGQDGLTPPIILYSKDPLETEVDDSGLGFIQVPWESKLVALDGETQLAARVDAGSMEPKTKNEVVSVYLVHGKPSSFARQAFHDLNVLGIRPNPAVAISMDARDAVTSITREVIVRVPFFVSRVHEKRRQLRRRDPEVVTIAALRGACVTLVEGIGGVRFGARPVPVAKGRVPMLTEVAVMWFSALAGQLGTAIENRDTTVAAAPAVLSALGAVGHDLVTVDPDARPGKLQELLASIKDVDWKRGAQWEGIVGKFTSKGRLTMGGSKETAYAVYTALKDPNSAGYKKIRG